MKKLNIPSLEITKANFIKHAKAYDDFNEDLCDKFFANDAIVLQEKLLEYDELMQSSYLERNWTKSYLSTRAPLAIASNFCFKLPKQYDLNDFICTFSNLIIAYEEGKLEYKTARGDEIFPRQFDILKGGARIPKPLSDEFRLNYKNTRFFSVLHNNNLYKVDICKNTGLKNNFKDITKPISFAHLSLLNSDDAAKLYQKYEDYNPFFEVIENSRFNICIINKDFNSINEEVHYMQYHAPCYHYKTLNFIYNEKNKNIYINAEHSFLDGGTIAYILEYIDTNLISPNELKEPYFVEQYFDDEYIKSIQEGLKAYNNLSFNANFSFDLAKDFGFSKDFILQAAIVNASKNAYKKYVCQYEAVDMRDYDYGRTECVRAISLELQAALKSFNKDDFVKANNEHKTRIKDCKKACGIDRHLLGLKTLIPCIENKYAKEFFNSKMYKNTCETIVSTSSLGKSNFVDVFYFHPVCENGIGVSYAYYEGKCYFTLTYFDEKILNGFKDGLAEFFDKFNNL
ncbi:choline/carnitine o-acyltransferase [Campylobacter sp. RM5004]|uniref:choline/carnitine O-acyltransferase n=1 Tax=Campylobacter sp. RM5004 TaxID=1660078 RepID=UPI001EFBD4D5|nr:choline/carnitine O-acyltransferase [Campylobacter sp. RM5004]ULO00810.1 choline/carnitine o-acyltransferase [Campylobacter sp. RM5004]